MKINIPVTNNEIQFSDNTFMLTKTDIKGVITYTNADFIRVSGFSEAELVGSSHNLVRHPDMPIEAFADMWAFLKAGKPWTGMVKNRTKSGDYYWVEANAAPIYENGQITGYLSARKKPTRTQVEVTDAAYRLFKDGKAKGLRIEEGKVVRDSIGRSLKAVLQNLNINQRISAIIALSVAMAVMTAFSHYGKTYAIPNAILGLALGLAIVLLVGMGVAVMRSITRPLKQTLAVFDAIASNHLDTYIDVEGNSEMSSVLRALKTTQTMLTVNESAQRDLSKKIEEESVKYEAQLAAIAKSSGVVEFDMDGKIIAANDIFLKVMGYVQGEVMGQHHSTLVLSDYSKSADYIKFWQKLNAGEAIVGEFRYMAKGGKDVWLQASYNPIVDATGKPYKVVEYAADVTEAKLKNADFEGKIEAIGKSQGEIEVGLDGSILKINALYLSMLGYSTSELLGKQFSTLFDSNFAKSAAYSDLWNQLVQGGAVAGQCKRIAKNGKEVWIQTSYNPIMDLNNKPFKIVNYAVDISAQKIQAADYEGQIAAINKIQGVIEFDLTGKITAVNENFANVTGYSEKEIIGNHHSMFVEPVYKSSHEYKAFWDKLNRGEADSGQYKRIGKGGNEIWLQASCNPILDMNGKPFKVMKYATDITEQHAAAATLAEAVEETQGIIEGAKTGDLSSRVSLAGKTGAIASLCDGVNALMDKMTEIIVQVREAGETINTAAGEISSGNSDLSSRTEQQASSLEETAASMEELASTVKNNAENAKQANQLAIAASGIAVKGGKVVSEVVTTMSAINTSAKKIEDIISVIDGIAFQTNILALNAAVEAARAGEQGRGFAVVAGEVRNLAQRSASAAKEIKELITDSVSKTAEGTAQVETAGSTMQEIVASVQRVTDIMAEITAASVEQSAGIDQVNTAVTSMDEVTQQNAALVEEAAAAAESLVDQAASLTEVVSVFKLSEGSSFSAGKPALRTIARKSPARLVSSSPKSATRPATPKVVARIGPSDGDWEEF